MSGGKGYTLRLWENEDVAPRPDDVFQERLYCIHWVETWRDRHGTLYRERAITAHRIGRILNVSRTFWRYQEDASSTGKPGATSLAGGSSREPKLTS